MNNKCKRTLTLMEMMSYKQSKSQVSQAYKFLYVTDIKKLNFGTLCLREDLNLILLH